MRFFELKLHQNPFSAGALPRTHLGELMTLPQTHSWLGGGTPPQTSSFSALFEHADTVTVDTRPILRKTALIHV